MDGAAEDMCANKSVGDTENHVAAEVKACADETADVGEKTCADEAATNVDESCVDEAANVDESCDDETAHVYESGDESAVFENPVGIANDWLGDDNVPLAPPLLHGSCTVHGSTRTPELSTPNCREPTLVS